VREQARREVADAEARGTARAQEAEAREAAAREECHQAIAANEAAQQAARADFEAKVVHWASPLASVWRPHAFFVLRRGSNTKPPITQAASLPLALGLSKRTDGLCAHIAAARTQIRAQYEALMAQARRQWQQADEERRRAALEREAQLAQQALEQRRADEAEVSCKPVPQTRTLH